MMTTFKGKTIEQLTIDVGSNRDLWLNAWKGSRDLVNACWLARRNGLISNDELAEMNRMIERTLYLLYLRYCENPFKGE